MCILSSRAHFYLDFSWDSKLLTNGTDRTTSKERDFTGLTSIQRFFNVITDIWQSHVLNTLQKLYKIPFTHWKVDFSTIPTNYFKLIPSNTSKNLVLHN